MVTKTEVLKLAAFELGFELTGVTQAGQPKTFDAFERWLDAGYHAGMNYLAEKKAARKSPETILPGVRSILMLGVSYDIVLSETHPVQQLAGIAEYARGVDYHDWIRQRLKQLSAKHRELFPMGQCRGTVDTAPILEKQFAADAGLGRIGKNTLLINPKFGTKFFLAALLSTEQLEELPKESPETNSNNLSDVCGDCQRCLDFCPVNALVAPFVLDARRCLNYWTIEHRGTIPAEIQTKLGNRFFGCDTCQNVCPRNKNCAENGAINSTKKPEGTIDPKSLSTETLQNFVIGSPLERKFRLPRHDKK